MAGQNKMAGQKKIGGNKQKGGLKWREMLNERAERERWHVVAHLFKVWRDTIGEREKSAGKCRRTELLFKWVADKINFRCAK